MSEYLAPGVYVEEVSFRSKSIEGVSTTTTGFVGPARYGPVTLEPDVLTSLLDFERVYGDRLQLLWGNDSYHNYLWHAVRAFFDEGGKRLYTARVFRPMLGADGDPKTAAYAPLSDELADDHATPLNGLYQHDGHARSWLTKETAAVGAAVQAVKDVTLAFSAAKAAVADFQEKAQASAHLAVDSADTELRALAAAWTLEQRLTEIEAELTHLDTLNTENDLKDSAQAVFDLLERARLAAELHFKITNSTNLSSHLQSQDPQGNIYEKGLAVKTGADVLPFAAANVKPPAQSALTDVTAFIATVHGIVTSATTAAKDVLTSSLPAPQLATPKETAKRKARELALAAANTAKARLEAVGAKLDEAKAANDAIPASFTHNTINTTTSKNASDTASVVADTVVDIHLALGDASVPQDILDQAATALAGASGDAKTALPSDLTPFTSLGVPGWNDVALDLGKLGPTGEAVNDADTAASAADAAASPSTILLALSIAAEAVESTRKTDKKTIGAVQATSSGDHQHALDAQTTVHHLLTTATATLSAAIFAAEPRAFAANLLADSVSLLATEVEGLAGLAAETGTNVIEDAPTFDHAGALLLRARFPGAAGNFQVRFTLRFGQNTLVMEQNKNAVRNLLDGDLVWISNSADPTQGELLIARATENGSDWYFTNGAHTPEDATTIQYWLNQPQPPAPAKPKLNLATQTLRPVTLAVELLVAGVTVQVWDGLALQPGHTRSGAEDSLSAKFRTQPASAADAQTLPFVLLTDPSATQATAICQSLFEKSSLVIADSPLSITHTLLGGNDGQRPGATEYEGTVEDFYKTGLKALEDIEDISIVAAPGSTYGLEADSEHHNNGLAIINALIIHAQRMNYRIAVLDAADNQSISQVQDLRGQIDSKYAAIYYPWVKVLDPVTRKEIHLPPSGFVAGIYARNDIQRAVWKAPANEVVNLAIGFEKTLNKGQQEVLNPQGINCFRYFPGRGYRLWGARTISSDPEWKYVNLRRYFAYLEHSIDKGTQWAVFEPNGERLWDNVRRTVYDFMLNEWQNGALLGEKPDKAFFVRCDRSTMTQNDLDNGRLKCLIGLAPLRPAEFVIFQIGQWTADHKV